MKNIHASRIDFEAFSSLDELIGFVQATYDNVGTREKAMDLIRKKMPKESFYQTKILKMIKSSFPDAFAWKEAAGPYSRSGIPDISCIYKGRYIGFEVKRPFIGVVSPIQKKVMKQIRAAGGETYVVSFESEVREILERMEAF